MAEKIYCFSKQNLPVKSLGLHMCVLSMCNYNVFSVSKQSYTNYMYDNILIESERNKGISAGSLSYNAIFINGVNFLNCNPVNLEIV